MFSVSGSIAEVLAKKGTEFEIIEDLALESYWHIRFAQLATGHYGYLPRSQGVTQSLAGSHAQLNN